MQRKAGSVAVQAWRWHPERAQWAPHLPFQHGHLSPQIVYLRDITPTRLLQGADNGAAT